MQVLTRPDLRSEDIMHIQGSMAIDVLMREKTDFMSKGLGVKITMGKPTEIADPNAWDPMNSWSTAREPARDFPRPSACSRQLCRLVCLWDHWRWNQDLSLVHKLAFWNPFVVVECPARPWCRVERLGPAST